MCLSECKLVIVVAILAIILANAALAVQVTILDISRRIESEKQTEDINQSLATILSRE